MAGIARTRSSIRPRWPVPSRDTYLGGPELANAPRKFRRPSGSFGSDIATRSTMSPSWASTTLSSITAATVGGQGPVDHPRLGAAGRLRHPDPFSTSGTATSRIFRDYGYRRLRNKARLKFLMAGEGGGFRQVLQDDRTEARPAMIHFQNWNRCDVHRALKVTLADEVRTASVQ